MQLSHGAQVIPFPGASVPPIREQRNAPGIGLDALSGRLTMLAELAPDARVSVVVVSLPPSLTWDEAAVAEGVVRANVRATDTVIALGEGRIGVVLQGGGARRAAETAGRVRVRLQRTAFARRAPVSVAAATGIGRHGRTLLNAATSALPGCG